MGSAKGSLHGSMQSNPFVARTSREVRHDEGDSVDGLAPATRGAFSTTPGRLLQSPRVAATRLVPRQAPDAVAAHFFTFPEEAPPIGYRRFAVKQVGYTNTN